MISADLSRRKRPILFEEKKTRKKAPWGRGGGEVGGDQEGDPNAADQMKREKRRGNEAD